MTLGTMVSPSDTADAWRSLRIARRRGVGMEVGGALLESVLRFLAIQAGVAAGTVENPAGPSASAAAVALLVTRGQRIRNGTESSLVMLD